MSGRCSDYLYNTGVSSCVRPLYTVRSKFFCCNKSQKWLSIQRLTEGKLCGEMLSLCDCQQTLRTATGCIQFPSNSAGWVTAICHSQWQLLSFCHFWIASRQRKRPNEAAFEVSPIPVSLRGAGWVTKKREALSAFL